MKCVDLHVVRIRVVMRVLDLNHKILLSQTITVETEILNM